MIKRWLKGRLAANERLFEHYWHVKLKLRSARKLVYHWYDISRVGRHMFWGRMQGQTPTQLQARLLFYYHKLEKGMCMPGAKRMFGAEAADHVMRLLTAWEAKGFATDDAIYRGALDSLLAYRDCLVALKLDQQGAVTQRVTRFLAAPRLPDAPDLTATTPLRLSLSDIDFARHRQSLDELYRIRRSFRDFAPRPVERTVIDEAVRIAQLSPSACNRQPCRVHLAEDPATRDRLLAYQNGNRGFGDTAPLVLMVTADMRGFFDASERNQPYVDGGLFAMSLLLGLQAQGLVSCCLNWCVAPASDKAVHRHFGLDDAEAIVMLIAVGYPKPETLVPLSHRKHVHDVVRRLETVA
ncbi:nitroreductase family protein [Chitiniphilus eburneus]|uniref:Nitroreductase family protein n=1 Tax=Chitiniphilus eburneus TaxID=2571148 RepID=A0A4U0PIY4_9NEIS|nr:nitroreductase family protein [Chitiniphilus eburneus]TJZ67991.1 nitroreductase family protein [Chitiniphilus eburneus]